MKRQLTERERKAKLATSLYMHNLRRAEEKQESERINTFIPLFCTIGIMFVIAVCTYVALM